MFPGEGIKHQGQDSPKRQLCYKASHMLQTLEKLSAAQSVWEELDVGKLLVGWVGAACAHLTQGTGMRPAPSMMQFHLEKSSVLVLALCLRTSCV